MTELMNVAPDATPDELRRLATEVGRLRGYTPFSMKKHRLGVGYLLDWLMTFDGVTWQERWEQAEAQMLSEGQGASAETKFQHEAMRLALPTLTCLRVIRPSYPWLDTFKSNGMARCLAATTDAEAFDLVAQAARARVYAGWRAVDSQNCLALLLMHTGKRLRTLTTADLLAFDQARLQGMFSNIGLLSLYQLLVDLEVVEDTPLAYSWNAHLKPLAIRTMLIEEGLDEPKILSVFEAYFAERQLTLAPDSVMRECRFLIRRFWKQIPETERQQSGFNLSFQTAQQLKASLRIHPRTGRQTNPKRSFHAISALYAFLNRKAAENPSQWREFAAESPISSNESRRAKLIQDVALDKMQQHTLSLLPHLTQIRRLLKENYEHAQELLTHTLQSEGGEVFQVGGVTYMKLQSEDVTRRKQAQEHLRDTIKRADSKGRGHFQIRNREEQAFWMWASVEILIRTGLRPVELFKLKRTDLINRRSATGMRVASLRIAASKTILPRIIDLSPEAFSFICRIIDRVQANHDTYPVVDRYDCVSKSFELSQPFLLQLQYSARRQAFRGREIQYSLHRFFKKMHSDGKLAEGVFLGLKDCRRIFATRLYQKNVPILAISYALGHADVKTTMHYIAYQGDDLHMHLDNLWESI